MKSERENTSELKKFFEKVPGCKFHILYDTGTLTHRKPYDFYIIYKGCHISCEAKNLNGALEAHQKKALCADHVAGVPCFVVRYYQHYIIFTPVTLTEVPHGSDRVRMITRIELKYADRVQTFLEELIK